MIVIGVGLGFSLLFHILVRESCQFFEQEKAEAVDQVELQQEDLDSEQWSIKSWLTLKRFYMVSDQYPSRFLAIIWI
jgi:hypothetical protein